MNVIEVGIKKVTMVVIALNSSLSQKIIFLQVMDVTMLKQHMAKQHQQTGAAPGQKDSVKGEGHLCPDCGKKCQYLSELEIHMAIQHMGIALERPSAKEEEVMCHECGKVRDEYSEFSKPVVS